jgi:hypothetical protein
MQYLPCLLVARAFFNLSICNQYISVNTVLEMNYLYPIPDQESDAFEEFQEIRTNGSIFIQKQCQTNDSFRIV